MNLTVLYVKDTGHVVSALMRTAPGGRADPPKDAEEAAKRVFELVADALPIRSIFRPSASNTGLTSTFEATLSIPAERLLTLDVDADSDTLLLPREYVVVDGKTIERPSTTPAPTLTLTAGSVNLQFAAGTPPNLAVQVYVIQRGATEGQYFHRTFDTPPAGGTLAMNVQPPLAGDCAALVLVQGYSAQIKYGHV